MKIPKSPSAKRQAPLGKEMEKRDLISPLGTHDQK
jgi:hypothetical protein